MQTIMHGIISTIFEKNTLLKIKSFLLLFLAISLVADNEKPYSIINVHTTPRAVARPKTPIPSAKIVLARNGKSISEIK